MTILTTTGDPFVDNISTRAPDVGSENANKSWSVCGRNFVVAVTRLHPGDPLVENQVADEYALIVPDQSSLTVQHGGATPIAITDASLVIVPAGSSIVRATSPTTIARVFTSLCGEQMSRAVNNAAGVDPRTTPLPPPTLVGACDIRVHALRDVPEDPERLGRIFRTTSLMINWFPTHEGPRDTERLSPHAHENFEQISLTLTGRYIHHLRTPWTPRMSEWREDRHADVASPSMTLIPPAVIHTSRAIGPGPHTLIDVFAPPRKDFLARGWVLNADDYTENP